MPWETGCYRICWLNKSAFAHTHTYSSGVEALHPHKSYKKCECGYYYYTGETRKLTSCKTCYPSSVSSSTYSISNNVITLKGVRLYEYPIGSKFSNSYYCNINGQSVNVKASQCYGFACYIEYKLHGCCWHTSSSHYPNLQGSENVRALTTSKLKDLITKAGVGAHLRTNKLSFIGVRCGKGEVMNRSEQKNTVSTVQLTVHQISSFLPGLLPFSLQIAIVVFQCFDYIITMPFRRDIFRN